MKYISSQAANLTTQKHSHLITILIVMLLTVNSYSQDLAVQLSPTSSTSINAIADYIFLIFPLTTAVPSGATLAVTFPAQYSTNTLHSMAPYSSYSTTNGDFCWPFGSCSVGVSLQGSTFFFTGMFPQAYDGSGSYFTQLTVFNIKNPDSLSLSAFTMTIYQGSTIYYPPSGGATVTPPSFTTSTMAYTTTLQASQIWATSTLTITLTPDTLIDTLVFNLPSIWTNETVISSAFFSSPLCSSNTNPTTTCSILGSQLIASDLQYYTSGQTINITILSMYNPSSLINIGSITTTGQYGGIDKATATITIPSSSFTYDIPRKVTSSIVYQPGDLVDLTLTFLLPHFSMSSDVVHITLPPDFVMSTQNSDYSITGSNTATTPSITFYTGNNTFAFSPFSIDLITRASLTIVVSNINRPRESKTTANISINTYRAGSHLMNYVSCCSFQLTNRQTLTSVTPQLSSYSRSLSAVTYTFNLTTAMVTLITTDALLIEWPPIYSSQISSTNNATVCAGISLSGTNNPGNIQGPTCSLSLNKIKLTNFLISNTNANETFIVTVSGITNPSSSPTSGFNLATVSSNDYILQEIKALTVILTANTLSSFTVSATSSISNQPNTMYTFTVGNNAPLINGYTIQIDFPADYIFIDYEAMICTVAGGNMPCGRVNSTYDTASQSVRVAVNASLTSVGSVTVTGVTNPRVQTTTAPFSASVIDTSGSTVQSSTNSPSFTVTGTGPFSSIFVTAYNMTSSGTTRQSILQTINTSPTSLFLYLGTPFNTQTSPSSLILTINNSSNIQFSNSSSCSSSLFADACVFSIDGSSNVVVTFSSITFTTANTNYIDIRIDNVMISYTGTLTVRAILSINGNPSLSTSTPVSVGQMYSESVSNYSVVQSSHILGQSSVTLTVTIGFSSYALGKISSIQVYIPQQFGTSSNPITIPVSSFINDNITLTGLTNPTTLTYSPLAFIAYDSNSYPIAFASPSDSSKQYGFVLNCTLPCRTCSSGNTSSCLSCYSSLSWLASAYLSNATNTCNTGCLQGEYLSGNICYSCNSSCLTCLMYGSGLTDGNKDTCLSCNSGEYLFNSSCYGSCPDGYFPSSNTCSSCLSVCLTCSDATSCLTCLSTMIYLSGQCLTACPSSYVALTNASLNSNCLPCPSNCLVCTSTVSCSVCYLNYYLSGSSCVSNCTSPLLPNYLNQCTTCACLTCSDHSYICTSCSGGLSLYKNQCLSNCPIGYYAGGGVCFGCMSNCSACSSATYCTICLLPSVLSITNSSYTQCLSACPSGTIATINPSNFSYICSPCTDNCFTCQIDTFYCLSCSSSFYLSNHSCVNTCPTGQFGYNGSCVYCYPQCQRCDATTPSLCSVCSGGYYFFNNTCLSSCPSGYYANISTLQCTLCSPLCQTCVNSTNCTSCVTNYFLYINYCYNNCQTIDTNYYSYSGQCLYCQPECSTCYNTSPYHCVSCSHSSYYYNPTTFACTSNCTAPYYYNSSYCVPCELPCITCDTTFNSCLTCNDSLLAYKGACVSTCPDGYSDQSGKCEPCSTYCLICSSSRCLVCQPYAYLYFSECVLDCSITNLPITIDNYCTSCSDVPYCTDCLTSVGVGFVCFLCVYPYVVFQGNCLNQCPLYYAPDASYNCQPTSAYAEAKNALYEENKPQLPPFSFLVFGVILGIVGWLLAKRTYRYTYHCGYLIALASVIDLICILYGLYYIFCFYPGDYTYNHSKLPLIVLSVAFAIKIILSVVFLIAIIGNCYLDDIRYDQWHLQHLKTFRTAIVLVLVFGPRIHKLFYSKLLALPYFCYRILSVEKFYREDVANWLLVIPDLIDIASFVLVTYNIFIAYAVLYLLPFQVITIKCILWALFLYDLKKPDRGFFMGDQENAEKQIKAEEEEQKKQQRQFQIEGLAKLIKCQSAGHLHYDKLYEHLFWEDDNRSVFDPKDYEDVPKVSKKKIPKYIERGKFRKGKKISIEEKLLRFASSIKPNREIVQDSGFMNQWLYWKPPKKLRVKPNNQPKQTQESMLNLLRDKEVLYESELRDLEVEDLDLDSNIGRDSHYRHKKRNSLIFEMDQETIGHQTFYQPTSIEYLEEESYHNELLNRNYAKKQHLPDNNFPNPYDEHELRILHHQPQKKRAHRVRLNDMGIRRG